MSEHSLWGGRFSGKVDPIMEAFNASIKFDKRLWKEDIEGSIAYAKAIHRVGLLTDDEKNKMIDGLNEIKEEWQNRKFVLNEQDEDIHTANERRLKELIGPIGGKLHTGRSRNDQVATDTRLWCRKWVGQFLDDLKLCIKVIVTRADLEKHILMPGYTHLQQAQPIRWSHWLMSFASALKRDYSRFQDLLKRIDLCPLGSGALAGNPFNIDRRLLAKELQFGDITTNSLDGVSSRDYIVELQSCATICAINLSRLSEDLIIYSSKEFSFVRISDAYSTGSSLMPQKKNPDSLELIRGKSGRITGQMVGFVTTLKGTPSTYNKDFQEDKESLFDVCDTIESIVKIASGVLATLEVNKSKCYQALTHDMLATDIAYYLVRKGIPFREAHSLSGKCVALSERLGCSLANLTIDQLKTICNLFESDFSKIWDFETSIEQYSVIGGTSLASVEQQIRDMTFWLDM